MPDFLDLRVAEWERASEYRAQKVSHTGSIFRKLLDGSNMLFLARRKPSKGDIK